MLLAGDIGGTKTRLAIFSPETGPRIPLAEATFPSGRYSSLEMLVLEFLAQTDLIVERASFGVAGPIVGSQATITNLPWVMATGGMFLGGGIPPRILPALEHPNFLQAFTHKGHFSDLLANIPVHVIRNPKATLLGAALHGLEPSHD